ncbi:tRNA adenosine(34) deaminase TadA [Tumebacillus sp. DT12]|uniref:tRNA-specific adenosine deaminase n=1 Tax=Tumebacillus lacus TaxID=2995335 RepID=A0ABT3X8C9_9BACL|nr:tRNA adenosine(34) deaminase TadA [Tumebacillus lacus]MCX7571911.1 tRNA adenosine(34) deaminase TadA [Tumebacillus lacus]
MTEHEQWMREALKEAEIAASYGEVPIGAVIVRDGEIIARGHNRRETWKDPTAHAETIAIREAARVLGGWRLTNCRLYVTLEPCPMCAGSILLSRVDEVFIGAMDAKGGAVGSQTNLLDTDAWNHRPEITTGILADACSMMLKEFFRNMRKKR